IGPYFPGSSAAIIPPAVVWLYACANVAHGAAMVHGFESLPAEETKVRVRSAACAGSVIARVIVRNTPGKMIRVMAQPLFAMAIKPHRPTTECRAAIQTARCRVRPANYEPRNNCEVCGRKRSRLPT